MCCVLKSNQHSFNVVCNENAAEYKNMCWHRTNISSQAIISLSTDILLAQKPKLEAAALRGVGIGVLLYPL